MYIWEHFNYRDPTIDWVVGILCALVSLGGMITNLVGAYKVVREYKECFELGKIADQLGFFEDW